MTKSFDAIIIGAGQAGPSLASHLAKSGMSVAIIERKLFGGTCVNTGCIPTKTLIASARAAHMARRAAEFGVIVNNDVKVDMKKVKARKDRIAGTNNDQIPKWMKEISNITVFKGHARFESADSVRVRDDVLSADKIFINVGGRALIPDLPGIEDIDFWTNSDMMNVDFLPEHLIIVGGSYIGLEFGQMYRRFGSKVTIIEKGSRLIQMEDEDVSESVQEILESEGITIRLNAECISFGKTGKNITANVNCKNGKPEISGSNVLLAVGRIPNTHDLNLEKAGVEIDNRGYIIVNDELKSSAPGIWALGDCNGKGAFTHTAYNDYEIVAANLLSDKKRKVSDRILCYGLYVDPPLGRAGMTEEQIKKSGRKALVAKKMMAKVGRAREKSETSGFMKVLIDEETKHILGAAVLGTGGDEIIHSILDVMYAKQPYSLIKNAVHIHPTVSELIPTMLADLKPLT